MYKRIIASALTVVIFFSAFSAPKAKAIDPVSAGFLVVSIGHLALDAYRTWRAEHPSVPDSEFPGYNPGGVVSSEDAKGGHFSSSGSFGTAYDAYVETLPQTVIFKDVLGSAYPARLSDGSYLPLYFIARKNYFLASTASSLYRGGHFANLFDCKYFSDMSFDFSDGLSVRMSPRYYDSEYYLDSRFSVDGVERSSNSNRFYSPDGQIYSFQMFLSYDASGGSDGLGLFLLVYGRDGDVLDEGFIGTLARSVDDTLFNALGLDPERMWYYDALYNPLHSYDTIDPDIYIPATRPASITGNYGVITESGDVQQIESQTIVNEGDSTIYNPVTNTTHSITDWTYDYSDRSYTATTNEGDTITVTYGDEHVTINEGGETYNVYYIVSNSGSSSGTGSDGSDIGSGSGTGTGTGAGGEGLLSKFGRLLGIVVTAPFRAVGALIGTLLDYLIELAEMISDKLTELVEMVLGWFDVLPQMFDGFLDFLGACFSFLPSDMLMLMTFGLAAVVFVGILKAVRGR